jgi:hypothetical protein
MYETMAQPTHVTGCVMFPDLQCRAVHSSAVGQKGFQRTQKARYSGSVPVETKVVFSRKNVKKKKLRKYVSYTLQYKLHEP